MNSNKTILLIGWASAIEAAIPKKFSNNKVIRFDISKNVNPDILGYMTNMEAIANNSIDEIICPFVLQHIFMFDTGKALAEAFRILKDGGNIYISVPDGKLAAQYIADGQPATIMLKTEVGEVNAVDILYGFAPALSQGLMQHQHRAAFGIESLSIMVRDAGFTNIIAAEGIHDISLKAYKFSYTHPDRVEIIKMTSRKDNPEIQAKIKANLGCNIIKDTEKDKNICEKSIKQKSINIDDKNKPLADYCFPKQALTDDLDANPIMRVKI